MTNQTVFVDCDGTLVKGNAVNDRLVAWLRVQQAAGYPLVLWSMQGADYAREVAERLQIVDLFTAIVSKPRFVVDDAGWSWIRFARCILFSDIYEGKNLPNL